MFENVPENWLERRDYPDLPEEAERALRVAAACWDDPEEAEAYLARAEELAPDHIQVLIGTYKYLFYKHKYELAAEKALACVHVALQSRQIHKNLLDLEPKDLPFGEFDPEIRFLLSAIMAYGYCLLRQGKMDAGREVLDLLMNLDISGQTSVLNLVGIIDRGPDAEDEEALSYS